MAATIEADQLRAKAREAIRAGKLPAGQPMRVWGGHGFGTSCAICGKSMNEDEIGFELQFAQAANGREYHTHARCFAAWDIERHSPLLPASGGNGTISSREHSPDNDDP